MASRYILRLVVDQLKVHKKKMMPSTRSLPQITEYKGYGTVNYIY